MFSVCAGILIGLKLYVYISDKLRKNKEEKEQEEEAQLLQYESILRNMNYIQEVENKKKELEARIELEKAKRKAEEKQFNDNPRYTQFPTNKFTDAVKEQYNYEKAKQIIRDIWYGSSYQKAKEYNVNKEFEDLLGDPCTFIMTDKNNPTEIRLVNKDKTYIFRHRDLNNYGIVYTDSTEKIKPKKGDIWQELKKG